MSYKNGGWKEKYVIFKPTKVTCTACDSSKTDCGMACDGEVKLMEVDKKATYFVLRLDTDPHARAAARAYIQSVRHENPKLAEDIFRKVHECTDKLIKEGKS